jgi:hypothetical protein
MPLTDEERVSVKHHLGYPNANAIQTFVLGVPAAMEPLFMLEGAMNGIAPGAESRLRETIRRLDGIELQLDENRDNVELSKADEVEFRENVYQLLMTRYRHWQGNLCNLIGVPGPNPFDARFYGGGQPSINLAVAH